MAKRPTSSRTKKSATKSASKKAAGAQKRAPARSGPQRGPAAGGVAEPPSPAAAPTQEEKRGPGRPTVCTPEALEEILHRVSEGEFLEHVCRDEHLPSRAAVNKHRRNNKDFGAAYARAREQQMEAWEYLSMQVATDGSQDVIKIENKDGSTREAVNHEVIARSRLVVEQMRWIMSKAAPSVYGDRVQVDVHDATPLSATLRAAKERARANGYQLPEASDGRPETAH